MATPPVEELFGTTETAEWMRVVERFTRSLLLDFPPHVDMRVPKNTKSKLCDIIHATAPIVLEDPLQDYLMGSNPNEAYTLSALQLLAFRRYIDTQHNIPIRLTPKVEGFENTLLGGNVCYGASWYAKEKSILTGEQVADIIGVATVLTDTIRSPIIAYMLKKNIAELGLRVDMRTDQYIEFVASEMFNNVYLEKTN